MDPGLSTMASEGLRAAAYEARGGPDDFFRAGADRVRRAVWLTSEPDLLADPDIGGFIRYEVCLVRSRAFVLVESESVSLYENGLDQAPFYVVERNPKLCRLFNSVSGERDDLRADEHQLLFQAIRQDENYPELRHARDALSRLRVYPGSSSKPRWALEAHERALSPRSSVVIQPRDALDPAGRGLINALYGLQQNEWVDDRFSGRRLADQMSEGMWSFLSLLAALLPADPAELIAFDEPDVHLLCTAGARGGLTGARWARRSGDRGQGRCVRRGPASARGDRRSLLFMGGRYGGAPQALGRFMPFALMVLRYRASRA